MDIQRGPFSPKRLSEALRDGTFGLPDFQRPSVWAAKQQVQLLESLCEDLPIGVVIASKFSSRGNRDTQGDPAGSGNDVEDGRGPEDGGGRRGRDPDAAGEVH